MHGNAGGPDRMALGLQPAGTIDRQPSVFLRPAIEDGLRPLANFGQAHRLIGHQFGDGEAVMHFHEGKIGKRNPGTIQRLPPCLARPFQPPDIALRQRQMVVDMRRRAKPHRPRKPRRILIHR